MLDKGRTQTMLRQSQPWLLGERTGGSGPGCSGAESQSLLFKTGGGAMGTSRRQMFPSPTSCSSGARRDAAPREPLAAACSVPRPKGGIREGFVPSLCLARQCRGGHRHRQVSCAHLVGISTGAGSLSGQMYLMIMTAVTYHVPITLSELREGTGGCQRAASALRGGSLPSLPSPIVLPAPLLPIRSTPALPSHGNMARHCHPLSPPVPRAEAKARGWAGFWAGGRGGAREVTLLSGPGPAAAARFHRDAWWSRAGPQPTSPRTPDGFSLLLGGQLQKQGVTHLKAALPSSSSKQK